jgi:enoyl-CoA hydratase/carnithine racemase
MLPPRGCRAPEEYAAPVSGPDRVVRDVLHVTEGRVTVLTLHRPDAKNAFNRALFESLREELDRAAASGQASVVVVTGAGDAFSAGADLREATEVEHRAEGRALYQELLTTLETYPLPLVAAVNGVAVGLGCTLLLHCDLVLMADAARVRLPFVTLGLTAEAGSSYLLPALVGAQEAAALLLTGGWMGAQQAQRSGLAWKVTSGAALLEEAFAVSDAIAHHPLDALVATKRLLLAARADAVRAAREREQHAYGSLLESLSAVQTTRKGDQ